MFRTHEIDEPVFVPQRRSETPRLVREAFGLLKTRVEEGVLAFLDSPDREGFLRLEQDAYEAFGLMSSHVVGGVMGFLHQDGAWVEEVTADERARSVTPLRHRGWRMTPVRFLGGARLSFNTPYLSENRKGRRGRTRGVGRRGKNGAGRYPALEALGVLQRATPALASEVSRQSVRTASFEEGREALAERGIHVTRETVRKITMKFGEEALRQRDARIDLAERGKVLTEEFAGRRVAISADGGRMRMREGGQRGRRLWAPVQRSSADRGWGSFCRAPSV